MRMILSVVLALVLGASLTTGPAKAAVVTATGIDSLVLPDQGFQFSVELNAENSSTGVQLDVFPDSRIFSEFSIAVPEFGLPFTARPLDVISTLFAFEGTSYRAILAGIGAGTTDPLPVTDWAQSEFGPESALIQNVNQVNLSEAFFVANGGGQTPPHGGDSATPNVVPLPAAGWMLLAGVGGLVALGRQRKASAA